MKFPDKYTPGPEYLPNRATNGMRDHYFPEYQGNAQHTQNKILPFIQ